MENMVIPSNIVSFTNGAGVLIISAIFVIGFILIMRYSAKLLPGVMSLFVYMISALMLVEVITYILTVIPGIGALVLSSALVLYIVRAVILALLIYFTLWIVLNVSGKNSSLMVGDSMMIGLGVGMGQGIIAGFDMLYVSTLGTTINTYGLEPLIEGMSETDVADIMESIETVTNAGANFYLFRGFNIVVDIIFFVFVGVLAYGAVMEKLPAKWHGIVIGLIALMTSCSAVYDYMLIDSYLFVAVLKVGIAVVTAAAVIRLDSVAFDNQVKSFSNAKKTGTLPKFGRNKK